MERVLRIPVKASWSGLLRKETDVKSKFNGIWRNKMERHENYF